MLIRCPDCGESISRQASQCPHCGSPFHLVLATQRSRRALRRWRLYSGFVVVFGGVIAAGDWYSVADFEIFTVGTAVLLLGLLGFLGSIVCS